MKDESVVAASLRGERRDFVFGTVLGWAFIVILLEGLLGFFLLMIWNHFLQDQPLGPLPPKSAVIIPFTGLMLGLWLFFVNLSGGLVSAALILSAFVRVYGFAPLWILVALVPVSGLVSLAQDMIVPTFHFYTDTPDDIAAQLNHVRRSLIFTGLMIPALLAGWWGVRRKLLS